MWLKGCLPFAAVLAFAGFMVDAAFNATADTYTKADLIAAFTALKTNNMLQPIGPGHMCSGTNAQACTGGTECVGLSDCKYCICNPYTYSIHKNLLSTYSGDPTRWYYRGYYSSSKVKCLKPVKIGESCEEANQCPDRGDGTARLCSGGVCACKNDMYHKAADGLSCVKSGYNQKCSTNNDCIDTDFKCDAGLCKCDNANYYYDRSPAAATGSRRSTACRRGYYDEACSASSSPRSCDSTSDAGDSAAYLTCDSGTSKCKCDPNNYITKGTPSMGSSGVASCENILVGAQGCTSTSARCYDGHTGGNTQTTNCLSDFCKCKETYPIRSSDGKSCTKIPYNKPGCKASANLENYNANNVETYTATTGVSRCTGTYVVCDSTVDKCLCANSRPKHDGTSCRKLYLDETGCKAGRTVAGAEVNPSDTSLEGGRCATGYCDTTTTEGTCKCPETDPIWDTTSKSCRKVKVGETGCGTQLSSAQTYTSESAVRCYGGTASTLYANTVACTSNACTCVAAYPETRTGTLDNKLGCRKARYNEACPGGQDSECEDDTSITGLEFKCSGGKCICNDANKWYTDGTKPTGSTGQVACKRINLGETCTGTASNDPLCETNSGNHGGTADCTNGKCTCTSGERQYGVNICRKELEYDQPCLTANSNQVQCEGNMTCTSNKCACTVDLNGLFPSNAWKSEKNQCLHTGASYTVTDGNTCTHSQSEIIDPAAATFRNGYATSYYAAYTWRKARSSTLNGGGSATSPVLRCASSTAVCSGCDPTSNSEVKKCQQASLFATPSAGARPAIAVLTMVVMAVVALIAA